MQELHPVWCGICHLKLAPQDPTRVQVGLTLMHESCYRKQLRKEEIARLAQPKQEHQLVRVQAARYVH